MYSDGRLAASAAATWASLFLLLCSWVCGTHAAGVPPRLAGGGDIASILQSHAHTFSPNTTIYLPSTPGFFNVTERWTTFEAPTFSAAISPATEEDVVKIVKLATRYKIPFLATGGRHSYTTTIKALQNGLEIDLSQFQTIEVEASSQTLTVGPGVRVGQIFEPLWDAGLEIQTGSASCPSLIGVTIGGGVGRYQGVYGLLIDGLVSVRMVTADGRLLKVSKDSNADLFWAIRGAGANFGIITSATFKAHPVADEGDNFLYEFLVTAEQSSQYFQVLESMQPLPGALSSIMLVNYNGTTNETQVAVEWVYKGPEAEARQLLAPIFDLDLTVTAEKVVKWNVLVDSAFGGNIMEAICAANITRDLYSWNLKNYPAASYSAAFAKMQQYFIDYPGARNSALQFEFFPNQAMAAVPDNETAFPWRDTTGYINFNMLYDDADEATRNASTALGLELREDLNVDSGYPELTVFVNYAHGDEKLERIYGPHKLQRLAALKKKWDPKKIFSYNNGIPTRYP